MRVVITFEERDGKSGRGYAKVIEGYICESLKPIFDNNIKVDAALLALNCLKIYYQEIS